MSAAGESPAPASLPEVGPQGHDEQAGTTASDVRPGRPWPIAGGATESPAWTIARGERLVAWCALGVLVIATVYFVQRVDGLRGEPVRDPVLASDSASLGLPPVANDPPPVLARRATPADVPTPGSAPADLLPEEASQAARSRALPRAAPRAPALPPTAARKAEPAATSRVPTSPALLPPPMPVLVAAAPPPRVVARTRWETMRDEMTMCTTGGYIEGVFCEQRVRARYCDGWWGRASECPSGRQGDYGN
jgi:hypothetical protein